MPRLMLAPIVDILLALNEAVTDDIFGGDLKKKYLSAMEREATRAAKEDSCQ